MGHIYIIRNCIDNKAEYICISCSQVIAKGKSPKPSKEELKALLEVGLSRRQITKMYDRAVSTVNYWLLQYGLR